MTTTGSELNQVKKTQFAKMSFCQDVFWDDSLLGHPTRPDFTQCFHSTALIYIPCLFLWIFLLLQLKRFRNINAKHALKVINVKNWLFLCRVTFITAFLVLECLDFIHAIVRIDEAKAGFVYVTPIILLITLSLDLILVILDHVQGHFNSMLQFYFWFFLWLLSFPTLVSSIRALIDPNAIELQTTQVHFVIKIFYFFLAFCTWISFCFSDVPKNKRSKLSNEEKASVLSELLFTWMDPLFWQGLKKPLQKESVPFLKSELQAKNIVNKIEKHLGKIKN